MKRISLICAMAAASAAFATVPTIRDGSVTFHQEASRHVKIGYVLDGTPAVVTVDILTNGVSMGEATFCDVAGAVNKVVQTGSNTITWDARKA